MSEFTKELIFIGGIILLITVVPLIPTFIEKRKERSKKKLKSE